MKEWNSEWKQRILFTYHKHPLKYRGKLVGRALSLLLKEAKRVLPGNLILTTACVQRFVCRWNKWFADDHDPASPLPPLSLFELDVREMFPSMDREVVLSALEEFHSLVVAAGERRGKSLRFAINRQDRKLDRIGTGYEKYFTNITWEEVLNFCKFDVLKNDIFTMGGSVYRQIRGIAIGGTGSAQLANITLYNAEEKGYPACTPVPLDPLGLHPGDLPVHPYRYVDNLVGVKRRDTPLISIQENFEHIFGIGLQPEDEGLSIPSLLSELTIHNTSPPYIDLTMANKHSPHVPLEQIVLRYPDASAPTARRTVNTMIPSFAKQAVIHREFDRHIRANINNICSSMERKGYPKTWWKPQLRHRLSLWGVRPEVLHTSALRSRVPGRTCFSVTPKRPKGTT